VQSSQAAELAEADAAVRPDDAEADEDGLSSAELLQRELGAQLIEEIPHS
jgi:DNA polymerase-3 subunit gamma/tau